MSIPPCPAPIRVDVREEYVGRRHRRGLARLCRLVDFLPYRMIDIGDLAIGDAELLQALPVDLDGIALLPLLKLALRPVLRGVGAGVAAVAVGQALDQRWTAARARLVERLDRLAVHDVRVVAVDDDLRQAVGGSAVTSRA